MASPTAPTAPPSRSNPLSVKHENASDRLTATALSEANNPPNSASAEVPTRKICYCFGGWQTQHFEFVALELGVLPRRACDHAQRRHFLVAISDGPARFCCFPLRIYRQLLLAAVH
jgi:hypothetical protein